MHSKTLHGSRVTVPGLAAVRAATHCSGCQLACSGPNSGPKAPLRRLPTPLRLAHLGPRLRWARMRLPRCNGTTPSAPRLSPRPAWSWDDVKRRVRTALRSGAAEPAEPQLRAGVLLISLALGWYPTPTATQKAETDFPGCLTFFICTKVVNGTLSLYFVLMLARFLVRHDRTFATANSRTKYDRTPDGARTHSMRNNVVETAQLVHFAQPQTRVERQPGHAFMSCRARRPISS